MKYLCETCGKELEYKEQAISPGSSEPCMIFVPCCIPEAVADRIEYLENDEIPEMFDNITSLIDSIDNFMTLIKDENCFADSKEQRQDIEDYATDLLNRVKDLQTEGIK